MSLDGAFLHIVKTELINHRLIGARVDKIHQPSREEIIITFRVQGGAVSNAQNDGAVSNAQDGGAASIAQDGDTLAQLQGGGETVEPVCKNPRLLISANAASARLCLTRTAPENPAAPPLFCTLLRKHIGNGRLNAITQDGLERVLNFDFICTNEIGDTVNNRLTVEVMGRTSNIILTGENGKIIDGIKRVTDEVSSVRRIIPGVDYTPPPRDFRHCLLTCDISDIPVTFDDKQLLRSLEGVSPVFAREAVFYANGEPKRLADFLKRAKTALVENTPEITLISEKDGKPRDFCFMPVAQYAGELVTVRVQSANALLDGFFKDKSACERLKQRFGSMMKTLKTAHERVVKKIAAQKIELGECKERERLRVCGDLINANIYRLEKGAAFLEADNYISGEREKITLEPRLSPAQNAQKYYAAYKKLCNAEKMLVKLISDGERELLYLESVIDAAGRATGENELDEIRRELSSTGYLRRFVLNSYNKKEKKPKALPPIKLAACDGTVILVGRNNRQNDELTFKIARHDDIWLHTKDMAGSHVILRCSEAGEPPPETVAEAAVIAAYCSKGRESSQVPVDYTFARYVKKPAGSTPGYVIFTHNKTLYVTPDGDAYTKALERIEKE